MINICITIVGPKKSTIARIVLEVSVEVSVSPSTISLGQSNLGVLYRGQTDLGGTKLDDRLT